MYKMQLLEVSGAVRLIYKSLSVEVLRAKIFLHLCNQLQNYHPEHWGVLTTNLSWVTCHKTVFT